MFLTNGCCKIGISENRFVNNRVFENPIHQKWFVAKARSESFLKKRVLEIGFPKLRISKIGCSQQGAERPFFEKQVSENRVFAKTICEKSGCRKCTERISENSLLEILIFGKSGF